MKKAFAEVISQPTISELEARVAKLEALVEQHHPTPKIEALQPYAIDSNVYSLADPEARYPLRVLGYRGGRILLITSPGEPEREFPIESVVPFSKCRNAEINSERAYADMFSGMDPKTREYYEGRRKAQIAAKTGPALPPPPRQQRRYGEQDQIPTWGIRPHIDD